MAGLIMSFSRYTKRSEANIVRDRITYQQRTLFLTDQELAMLIDDPEARCDREEDDSSHVERWAHVISWTTLPESQPGDDA